MIPVATVRRGIVLLGPPGVGKGTYASQLSSMLGYDNISVGDIVRTEIGEKTDIGKAMEGYSNNGLLVPDELVMTMLTNYLNHSSKKLSKVLIDGFPRTLNQVCKYFLSLFISRQDKLL